jgi:hypothetical protein
MTPWLIIVYKVYVKKINRETVSELRKMMKKMMMVMIMTVETEALFCHATQMCVGYYYYYCHCSSDRLLVELVYIFTFLLSLKLACDTVCSSESM